MSGSHYAEAERLLAVWEQQCADLRATMDKLTQRSLDSALAIAAQSLAAAQVHATLASTHQPVTMHPVTVSYIPAGGEST